ncbi:MAG TPA: type III-B CRISPR module-associated protein Cmr5 [Negativicutes bacterium]|nr:type III-B CRISPR module-associated protein Cmr5 [Negativicutes bacterium]
MKVQVKALLNRDPKGLWRVKPIDAPKHEKGDVVPQGLRDRFTDAYDGKRVTVEKVDGKIVKVVVEGESLPAISKQDFSVPVTVTDSPRPTAALSASIAVDGDNGRSCAVLAYRCAEAAKGMGKEYKNHAKTLPLMIRINGLGATLAFLKSKERNKGPHFERLYLDLVGYLSLTQTGLSGGDFSERIADCDSAEIMFLTKEALVFLAWLRRFAEGLIQE